MAGDLISLTWDGTRYELDIESITAREFKQIKQHTGLKTGQFVKALMSLDDLDADVAVALLWLFKTRAGEAAGFDEDLPVFKLLAAIERGGEDEPAPKAEEPAPTST